MPVQDFKDVLEDPQLAARGHFEMLEHPCLGVSPYEHNGFRLSDAGIGYGRPAPLLGQHTDEVLMEVLRLDSAAIGKLHDLGLIAGPERDPLGGVHVA